MRIALVEPSGFSGICQYSYALANALADQGHEVELVTAENYEMEGAPHRFPVVKLYRWISGSIENRGIWRFGLVRKPVRGWRYFTSGLAVIARFARRRPDVVHVQMVRGPDILVFAALRIMGIPLVYTAHEVAPDRSARWAFDWLYHRALYALPQRIIVHSEGDRAKIMRLFGVKDARIGIAPLGDYLFFTGDTAPDRAAARRRLGLEEDAQVILFFGVLRPNKGLQHLIDAFGILAPALPRSRLLIASAVRRGVAGFEAHDAAIDRLGIRGQVVLQLDYIPNEDLPVYFAACDVVALPYLSAHNSGVIQVAYAFARPVVGTDVGSFRQVIEEGATGFVVPPGDATALAAALRRVLADPDAARRMGDRAQHLARTVYSWEGIARATADFYRGAPMRGTGHAMLPPP